MKRARDAYPEKYQAALSRKRARTAPPAVRAEVARQIRSVTDLKYTDATIALTGILSTGLVYSGTQTLIRGANGFDQFAGNQITPTGFQMKFQAQNGGATPTFLRCMCVQWFDASVPTPTGLLQSLVAPNGPIAAPLVTNKSQMRVLYDKTYCINSQSGDGAVNGTSGVHGKFYIPSSRLKRIRFNATTAAIQDGGIYTLFISDKTIAPNPSVTFYSRLSFTDA